MPPSGHASHVEHSVLKGHGAPTPAGLPVNVHTLMAAPVSSSTAGAQVCEPSG